MAEKNKKFMMSMTSPVHRELKIEAAKRCITLHQLIDEMIEKSLEEQGFGHRLRRRTGR